MVASQDSSSCPSCREGMKDMGRDHAGLGLWVLFVLLTAAPLGGGENILVINLSEAQAFQMGKMTSMRVVQPDVGAKRLTLNFSISQDGREFSQHVHDYSDDTI